MKIKSSVDYLIERLSRGDDKTWNITMLHMNDNMSLMELLRKHLDIKLNALAGGKIGKYKQAYPRQRILAALEDIQKLKTKPVNKYEFGRGQAGKIKAKFKKNLIEV